MFWALTLFIGFLLVFLVCEVMLSVFANWAFNAAAETPIEASRDAQLAFQLRPNYNSDRVHTDEFGFRRRTPLPGETAEGSVLVLGDSVAFASGLEYEKSFTPLLESMLTASTGRPTPIWNAATPGYNTGQEARQFELVGPRIRPTLTIVEFCMNDYLPPPSVTSSGKLNSTRPSGQSAFSATALLSRSKTLVFGKEKFKDLQKLHPEWFPAWAHYIHYTHQKPGWQEAKQALLRMKQTADSLGSRLLVVVFPVEQQLRIPDRTAIDDVLGFAKAHGIETLDLFPVFQPRWKEDLYVRYWADVGTIDKLHLNAAGHRVAADAIADAVLSRGLVAGAPKR